MKELGLQKIPKVGVGVMIFKDSKVLMGRRKSSHGEGEYASPGGHLEFGESFEDCAKREAMEEVGIEIENVEFMFVANLTSYANKHYVHIQLRANWKSGEVQLLEPDKCEGWDWYELENLPQPTFKTYNLFMESYKTRRSFFDS